MKTDTKTIQRRRIVQALTANPTGLTCDELERLLKLSHQTTSPRLTELRRRGRIVVIGKRPTRTGCMANVYKVK